MKLYTRGYFDGRDCDGGRGFKLYDFPGPSSSFPGTTQSCLGFLVVWLQVHLGDAVFQWPR